MSTLQAWFTVVTFVVAAVCILRPSAPMRWAGVTMLAAFALRRWAVHYNVPGLQPEIATAGAISMAAAFALFGSLGYRKIRWTMALFASFMLLNIGHVSRAAGAGDWYSAVYLNVVNAAQLALLIILNGPWLWSVVSEFRPDFSGWMSADQHRSGRVHRAVRAADTLICRLGGETRRP